jgi:hypothetical protein
MTLITTGLREAADRLIAADTAPWQCDRPGDRTARCWLALTLDCFGLTILMFLL